MKKDTAKGFVAGIIIALLVFGASLPAFGAGGPKEIPVYYDKIFFTVDGNQRGLVLRDAQENIVYPFVYNGTIYVPIRGVSEMLGVKVDYKKSTGDHYVNFTTPWSSASVPIVPTPTKPPVVQPTPAPTDGPAFPLHLYSNDGREYLGKLVTNQFDTDSIWNEFGTYGSKYSGTSIWNEYGTYGSKYSSDSAFNEFAINPPIIVDNNGKQYGFLTTNTTMYGGYTIVQIRQFLILNGQ